MRKSIFEKAREQRPERKTIFGPGMFYRRYYEDFLEYNEINEKGETVIRRVYQGTWYTADQSRRDRIRYKTAICAAWLISAAVFGFLIYKGTPLDPKWYMGTAHVVTALSMLWNYIAIISCLLAPVKMTFYEYKTSVRDYRISSRIAAFGFLGSALILLISIPVSAVSGGTTGLIRYLPFAAGYLAAAGIMFLAGRWSWSITYTKDASVPFRVKGNADGEPSAEQDLLNG